MKYLIAYDISNSGKRKDFMKFLISEGLIRIQKSVFLGEIIKDIIMKKIDEFQDSLEGANDSILIVPICAEDVEKSKFLGVTFDGMTLEKVRYFVYL